MDLSDVPTRTVRQVPLNAWFRFRRAVEDTPTILLLLEQSRMRRRARHWCCGGGGGGAVGGSVSELLSVCEVAARFFGSHGCGAVADTDAGAACG